MRSTLAARLSYAGADVVTAQGLHDPALTRGVRRRTVLVLDEDAIANRSDEWLCALVGDPHWHQVVILTSAPPPAPESGGERLRYVDRAEASAELTALLPEWREARVAGSQ